MHPSLTLLDIVLRLADANATYVRNPDYNFTCLFDIRQEAMKLGIPNFLPLLRDLTDQGKIKREKGDGIRSNADMYSIPQDA